MLPIETYKSFYNNIDDRYEAITENLLSFNNDTLDDRITRVAAYHGFLGAVVAYAKRQYDYAQIELDEIASKAKVALMSASASKLSDAKLENMILANEEVKAAKKKAIDLEIKYLQCKNLYFSVDVLKDMVVQASSNRRAEINLHNKQ